MKPLELYCLFAFASMLVLTSIFPKNFLRLGPYSRPAYAVTVASLVLMVPASAGLFVGRAQSVFLLTGAVTLGVLTAYVLLAPRDVDWMPIYRRVLLGGPEVAHGDATSDEDLTTGSKGGADS